MIDWKDSSTYRMILEEGREEGREEGKILFAHAVLLRQGTKRFGTLTAETQATLEAITSLEELEQLTDRVLETESWAELLAVQ